MFQARNRVSPALLLASTITSAHAGAHTAIKTGNKWLKRLFAVFAFAATIALVLL